jgi:hypothetical protein
MPIETFAQPFRWELPAPTPGLKAPLPLLREQVGVRGAPNKILMRLPRDPRPLRTVAALHHIANQDKVNVYTAGTQAARATMSS